MIKKILVCFFLVLEGFAIQAPNKNDYENFKKSLLLTPVQNIIIKEIEVQTKKKNEILYQNLKKTHKEIVNYNNNCTNDCNKRLPELREEMKDIEKKIYNNYKKQDELIVEILYPWQKKRYKEYRSRVY